MDRRYDVSEVVEIPRKKKKRTVKRIFTSVIIVVLIVIVAGTGGFMYYMDSLGINLIDTSHRTESGNKNNGDSDPGFDEVDGDDEEYYNQIVASNGDSDLKTTLREWYSNGGDHMSSKNVLNILIVGLDARDGSMDGNSDVMMLASVNKKKGTITLCSFFRDSYLYYETENGGNYFKLNSAYNRGGADALMNAIENNYKIKLDYFVAVNFDAFEKVIDAIGGVNLDVEQFEARAMEDYGHISGVPYGENVLLNGEQALLFARMRSIYTTADVQRTQNQRKVINAIIKKSRTLGLKDLNNVIQTLGQYVYTDCSTTKILSLGTSAILGKWYNFQVYSMEAPPESAREGGYVGPDWVWFVDYPYSAQYVQKQIYGETNIEIQ